MSGFLGEWWQSRPHERWWWRSLTLLVLAGVAGLALTSWLQGAKSLAERYRWSASQAILAHDWDAADLWLTKVAQLQTEPDQRLEFVTALVAEQRQDLSRARRVMENLAQAQYSEVRGAVGLWMAHDVLRHAEQLNREGLNLARDLLIVARRTSEPGAEAGLISEAAASAGLSPDAARALDELIPDIDDLRLRLAERFVPARAPVAGAEGEVRPAATPLPQAGSVDYYLRLAESHILLKSWTDAERVLLQGLQERNDARLKQALGELYVLMSVALEDEGRMPLPEMIRLLQRAESLAPRSPLVLDRLAMFLKYGPTYPHPVMARLATHIRQRLKEEPASASWRTAFVLLRILSGADDIREDCPESFLQEHPEARVLFARLYRQRRDLEKSRAHAQIAADVFRERLSNGSTIVDDRIGLAESLALLDRWKDAVDTLKVRGVAPHSPELRAALANVYLDWASHTPDVVERVNHLLAAWGLTPREPTIIVRLLELTRLPSELSGAVLTRLQDALEKGEQAALVSLLLGSVAASQDDYLKARPLLESAYRELSDEPILLNNLAWVLIHGDYRDAPRALKLINRAMARAPSTPELKETRCHVLIELRRWKEAIADLEAVLPMFPDRPELHAMLAKAYTETGQAELAHRHRQLAMQKRPESATAPLVPADQPPADAEAETEEPASPEGEST